MADSQTTYLGLKLKSPIIAGSSGLSKDIKNLKEMEKAGAGAVVLSSVFEEQIDYEIREFNEESAANAYPEAEEMLAYFQKRNVLDQYLSHIKEAKEALSIPVIASINCYRSGSWGEYVYEVTEAGADAIEVNIFYLPSDIKITGDKLEKEYKAIARQLARISDIPVTLKLSTYFQNVSRTLRDLSFTGIKGLVLFNRFYNPDIDIEKMKMISAGIFSQPSDFHQTLRWIGIMSDKVDCDLCASTGIHDGVGVVKMILAGAKAVQMVSAMYIEGIQVIKEANKFLLQWMDNHNYQTIEDFRGKLSQKQINDPAFYERVQFLKHFSEYKPQ